MDAIAALQIFERAHPARRKRIGGSVFRCRDFPRGSRTGSRLGVLCRHDADRITTPRTVSAVAAECAGCHLDAPARPTENERARASRGTTQETPQINLAADMLRAILPSSTVRI